MKNIETESLRFECQGSGKCCVYRGDVSFVFLTARDRERLAKHLGKPETEFAQQAWFDYTRFSKIKSKQWYLKNGNGQCAFLKDGKCSVYEARPTQCRTWPFWPEHMNAKSWAETAKFCAGIGKGPVRSVEDVADIVDEQIKADLTLKNKTSVFTQSR